MKTVAYWIGGLLLAFTVYVVIHANDPQQQEISKARRIIERCYEPVNDELNSRSERASVRELCRGLERDYEARFGHRF